MLERKGVKEALAEFGLTEELITTSLVSDIKRKPKRRLGELRLGDEILNMNDGQSNSGNKTLILVVSGQTVSRYGNRTNTDASDNSSRPPQV